MYLCSFAWPLALLSFARRRECLDELLVLERDAEQAQTCPTPPKPDAELRAKHVV